MPTPTPEQQRILDSQKSCVVIASPGSGKTFTIAEKIRALLPQFPHYRGVIALSYTNKASDELRRRVHGGGLDTKRSFFGTIDKFMLVELIYAFGPRVFGRPTDEPQVVRLEDLEQPDLYPNVKDRPIETHFGAPEAEWYGRVFRSGRAVMECNGGASVWILQKCSAARRYLAARYSWVFIDEYQDCGFWQHRVFYGLCTKLGLRGVAVGDLNQSIFLFAKKDPKYLESLTTDSQFSVYSLTANHRSHQAIVNYATRLLSSQFEPLAVDGRRVFYREVRGDESDIGRWIARALPAVMKRFGTEALNQIGILVKSSRTGQLVSRGLRERGLKHRLREETSLDRDTSLWGTLFRSLLSWLFSAEETKYDIIDRHLDVSASPAAARKIMATLKSLQDAIAARSEDALALKDRFVGIARALLPSAENRGAVGALVSVLNDEAALGSYAPAAPDEVHLMTLHKAKGLEFDLVFHLDMYEYIMPNVHQDERQDLNLHYVGVTRARHACVLCGSTRRHNASGQALDASPSPFLSRNGLASLRDSSVVGP